MEVIIKNISNRNIMSVIDDIEKTSIALVLLFIMTEYHPLIKQSLTPAQGLYYRHAARL